MAVVFCCPLNIDAASCQGDAAAVSQGGHTITIDNTIKKFGAGSLIGDIEAPQTHIRVAWGWNDPLVNELPGDAGAIGIWAYVVSGEDNPCQLDAFGPASSNIVWQYNLMDNAGNDAYRTTIDMKDSGGTFRVNADTGTINQAFTTGWHYWELNWLWNDAGGKSEVFLDGVSVLSDTGGNSFSRAGSGWSSIDFDMASDDKIDGIHLDDPTVWDTVRHTSGFSVPTSPNCVCGGAAPKRLLTLGSPFGMNPLGN